jgi:hypothetical protein
MGYWDTNGLISLQLGSAGNFSVSVTQVGTSFPTVTPAFVLSQSWIYFRAKSGDTTTILRVAANQIPSAAPIFVQVVQDRDVLGPYFRLNGYVSWILVDASTPKISMSSRQHRNIF